MSHGLARTQLYDPVVTTGLKQMIVGLQFPGHSSDDLGTGCQPFMVAYAGKAHHLQVTAAPAVADQLIQGDQNTTLADIRTIRKGEKVKSPLNASEMCVTLFRFAVLCETLFQGSGERHPYVESIWRFARGLKDIEPFVTDKYNELAPVHAFTNLYYYARIVLAVQVWTHEYLHRIAISEVDNVQGIEVPKFDNVLRDLTHGTFHQSTNWIDLPSAYLSEPSTTSRQQSRQPKYMIGSTGFQVYATVYCGL